MLYSLTQAWDQIANKWQKSFACGTSRTRCADRSVMIRLPKVILPPVGVTSVPFLGVTHPVTHSFARN